MLQTVNIRPATPKDAPALADLIVMAGDGLPLYVWDSMREGGETAMDVGRRRAQRTEGGFSYLNADVAENGAQVISSIISYALPKEVTPVDPTEVPAMFVPFLELETLVPDTWYINVLATYPNGRKRGAATALLTHAETRARRAGHSAMSIITGDTNPALQMYERFGFAEIARRQMVKDDWDYDGTEWVLLKKELTP
ncbi:GNAT family N-acetyltransferase [Aliiroseovarius sp. YM-037]|uniref:GNAT family N-acetyltransferase n=1 Tax=Aliiroseovarius sp. YM-037 TaxID=3341728 RepID=UPI003A7FDCE5